MLSIKELLRNPLTIWMHWVFWKFFNERKHASKRLSIGYLTRFINCQFGQFNTLYDHIFLKNVVMGDFSYISSCSKVTNTAIGKFSCIGPETLIGLGKHPTRDHVSIHPVFYSPLKQTQVTFSTESIFEEFSPITIGNDVWVGARAIIMCGITVGDGAIIGAGAVVTKDVPAYAVVGGVPAKVLRYRFELREIEYLRQLKWWDRDATWLRRNALKFRHICEVMQEPSDF